MNAENLKKALDEISQCIQRDLASGFADLDRIVPEALEHAGDDYPSDELRPYAEQILQDAIKAKLLEEKSWPAITDCDRFDASFAELEQAGIVCRHNFSCCGTCAASEIWDEIEKERNIGREIIGCAHYHQQDTESAVEGYGVYLSYGSVLRGERAALDIGRRIVEAMESHTLKVSWSGSLSKRIHVALDWKRRMPARIYK